MVNDKQLELSVVMPCLNEAETIQDCIIKAQNVLKNNDVEAEVIIADNGSTDGSQEIAKECNACVVNVKEKGYGAALMGGIASARGKYVIMGDADDSYDFSQIMPFVEKLRKGYDLIVGCRLPRGGGNIMPGAMPWKHRWIGNPVLSGLGRLFFKSPVSDFHCGLRGFSREAYRSLSMHTTGMEFASEMILKATLNKMRIAEVPITLYKDGRTRKSHLRSWHDGWRHLRFMLLYTPRWLFLVPGISLLLAGGVTGSILLFGILTIANIGFGVNTILISYMVMLAGFQLILFAFFTKVFAISVGLLPQDERLVRLNKVINLEFGLLVGSAFMLAGMIFLVLVFLYWKRYNFGPISYFDSLRFTIPGIMAFTLGVEIVFSSFFLSILGLRHR